MHFLVTCALLVLAPGEPTWKIKDNIKYFTMTLSSLTTVHRIILKHVLLFDTNCQSAKAARYWCKPFALRENVKAFTDQVNGCYVVVKFKII